MAAEIRSCRIAGSESVAESRVPRTHTVIGSGGRIGLPRRVLKSSVLRSLLVWGLQVVFLVVYVGFAIGSGIGAGLT